MNSFKDTSTEYINLGRAFNGMVILMRETKEKERLGKEIHEEICLMAYLCRIQMMDRMDSFRWPIDNPISVPLISDKIITLNVAMRETINEVAVFSMQQGIYEVVESIFEKGEWFEHMEKNVPENVKNLL